MGTMAQAANLLAMISRETMTTLFPSRRKFLAQTAAGIALGLSDASALAAEPPRLSRSAESTRIPYGAAVRAGALASDPTYRATVVRMCDMIVPEGEMKWSDIHPKRDEYRFDNADALVDFARQNHIGIRGHTLAWYGALPAWTSELASAAEAERELVDHIETVVSRYRGAVPSWDVVNEPLIDWPQDRFSIRPSIWMNRLGPEYLPIAFKATASTDPDAKLVLNEYDVEYRGARFGARRRALIQLLRWLRDRDVPLHAVGLQAHLFAGRTIDRDGLQALLAEIVALKLEVLITELDVIDADLPGKIEDRDALVAAMAAEFLGACCEVVRPKAILTWGLSDRYTWVPTFFKRADGMPNRPLPLDAEFKPKPLFDVIEEYRRKFT
ncbi:endo-1,4-beta-xylanase [Bradyrhizobium sp.]|uniref:endo-1,4-beta-xylanase n=1 Tax=Bradyrhizobium sp. TaxID=376 RepID=UPI002D7F38FF|nr:endo-1,4-beta-xylanase [Bradyrhizobium sp.]